MQNPTTRPVNLSDEATLRAKANAWIDANGLPAEHLVEQAIRRSDLAGDPLSDNPFRHALLYVTAIRKAEAAR